MNEKIVRLLINQVEKAEKSDEIPVGALVVDKKWNIIAVGCNNRQGNCNVLGHAEINAIIKAEKKINDWRLNGYDLIVNLEPCEMCSIIIKEARIDNVYYFVDSSKSFLDNSIKITEYPEYTVLFVDKLKEYFKNKR